MSTSLLKRISYLACTFLLTLVFFASPIANAAYRVIDPIDDNNCAKILVVFARGSGQGAIDKDVLGSEDPSLNEIFLDAGVKTDETQTAKFFAEFHERIPTGVKYVSLHNETSSTGQKYNKYGYVATSAFDAIDLPYDAYSKPPEHRSDVANRYYESVKDGAEELAWYLEDQMTSCPLQRVVLGGYSQGAEVVADGVNILKQEFRFRIAYIALYGDPKFNAEKPNSTSIGPWVRGNAHFLVTTHGILDARDAYVPDDVMNLGSWCASGDKICDAGHMSYKDIARELVEYTTHGNIRENIVHSDAYQGTWIPKSMPEIVKAVRNAVPDIPDNVSSIVYTNKGDKLWNLDLAVVIDDSSSMTDSLKTVRGNVGGLTGGLLQSYWNSRVGVVTYNGIAAGYDASTHQFSRVVTPFTNSVSDVSRGIQSIIAQPPYYGIMPTGDLYRLPEQSAQYSGIMTAIQDLNWEHGAQKKIIVITNNKAESPDPSPAHWTADQVKQAAFDLDPAGLNLANVSCDNGGSCDYSIDQEFQNLVPDSTGQISDINLSFGTVDDLNTLIQQMNTQPVASLSGDQTGYTNTPLQLSADESYDPNSALVEYDWDCTSDGQWDIVTSWPTESCNYSNPGDYQVTVRIFSDDGEAAAAVLPVHIMVGPAPVAPSAPEKPNAALTYGPSSMNLTWSNKYGSDVYIKVTDGAGNLIGYAPADTPGVTLSGIGSEVPALHISACTDAGGCSEPTVVPLDHNALEAMTVSDDADTFAVQEAVETPPVATKNGTEQNESATPNTPMLKTAAVFVPGEILTPNAFSDFISSTASSVLGDTTTSNIAKQFEYHGIAATSTTKNQNQPLSLKWRLIIGVPAIVLGVALLVRYFYVRKKS